MPPVEIDLELCHPSPKARQIDLEAVESIAASIEHVGLLSPITVRRVRKAHAGRKDEAFEVVAGMHRVRAFQQLGRATIPAAVIDVDDLHAELMLIDENLCRNDLTPAERASAQARRKAIYQKLHPETKSGATGRGRPKLAQLEQANEDPAPRYDEAAAETTGQSPATVRRDVHRGEALGQDALAKVARTSLDKGDELDALAKCSPEKRAELIDKAAAGEKVSAKTEAKAERRATRERVLGGIQCALPTQKFGVILADPEWRFKPWSDVTGMDRAADNHYPTSPTEIICARDVPSIAAPDCVLFLWATVPMLAEAFCVLDAWGFARFDRDPQTGHLTIDKRAGRYVSSGSWTKYKPGAGIGMGHWFRVDHEILLVATRGNVPAPAKGCQARSVFDVPASRVHSQKPEFVHEIIESYFPTLPKIELNRRGPARPGWRAWGLEAQVDGCDAHAEVASYPTRISPPVLMAAVPAAPQETQSDLPDVPEFLRRGADGLAPWQRERIAVKGAGPSEAVTTDRLLDIGDAR